MEEEPTRSQSSDGDTDGMTSLQESQRDALIHDLETDRMMWDSLPSEIRCDLRFAKRIQTFPTCGLASSMMRDFPYLRKDPEIWRRIIETLPKCEDLPDFLTFNAAREIMANFDLMMAACRRCTSMLECVDVELASSRDFISTVLQKEPLTLLHMPHVSQRLFPDLVTRTFAPLSEKLCVARDQDDVRPDLCLLSHMLTRTLVPQLWEDRAVGLEWFRSGFLYVGRRPMCDGETFPNSWRNDRDIFILIAKYGPTKILRQRSFEFCSPILRRDRMFMSLILEIDSSLFCCYADPGLLVDFDLALSAFAINVDNIVNYRNREDMENGVDLLDFIDDMFEKIGSLLSAHATFSSIVLLGNADPASSLSLLNQGEVTSASYMKLIAEYLDVLTGKKLRHCRRALANLTECFDRDWDDDVSSGDEGDELSESPMFSSVTSRVQASTNAARVNCGFGTVDPV